jgi:hypothetical protein
VKLPQYRNRQPLEYRPHIYVSPRRISEGHRRYYVAKWKPKKLPGVLVGINGIVVLLASEFIHESIGILLFLVGFILLLTGAHFEIVNRAHFQQKYFIVPITVVTLALAYLILPKFFQSILPRQDIPHLTGFSSGFPIASDTVTFSFGGGRGVSFTYTRKELEQAKAVKYAPAEGQIPFRPYVDGGRLFFDADVYVSPDHQPIQIRRNTVGELPFRWDGNSSNRALEIVNADTMPVFQLLYKSADSVLVRGIFPVQDRLAIADESGLSYVQGKRVLFYGANRIFKYPSWKYPKQRVGGS